MITSMKSRGVVDIVGSILTLAVVIGTFTAAMVIGKPLVTKRMDRATVFGLQQELEEIADAIEKVSEGGSVVISLGTMGLKNAIAEVRKDEYTGDYVLSITIPTEISFYAPTWVPINDESLPYTQDVKSVKLSKTPLQACSGCTSNYTARVFLNGELKTIYVCCDAGSEAVNIDGSCAYKQGSVYQGYTVSIDCENEEVTFTGKGVYKTSTGILGEDKPVVLIARSIEHRSGVRTELRLKTRIIRDPVSGKSYWIRLLPAGYEKGKERVSANLPAKVVIKKVSEGREFIEGEEVRVIDVEIGFRYT